ncbi:hypothetical protein [Streptomyces sp. NPDC051997]|uniref:hypothetical protein n=1 Tax=Streptomyces sp. NPDC051997 TaxID=3155611 RepID=UPI003428F7CF
MRSARMLLAAATATAALAIAAPGAYAATAGDWDHSDSSSSSSTKGHDDSGYGQEHDDSGYGQEHGKDDSDHGKPSWHHEKPEGGVHTGGGALMSIKTDDSSKGDKKYDPETYKDKDSSSSDHGSGSWDSGSDKGSWDSSGKESEEKPHGGMHTGGGGLATSSGVTAGGVGVLGLAAAGVYMLRRRSSQGGVA